jgi:hypothetical protein
MVMIRKWIGLVWLLFAGQVLLAQQVFSVDSGQGAWNAEGEETEVPGILQNVHINQDPRLEKMLKWHIENNKRKDGIDGYRVEIFFSSAMNAKERSLNKKKEFLLKYPEYNVHIKYVSPNFRVRVGDFRTKSEALKLYKTIEQDYPGAFIVSDIIDLPLRKTENYERPD